MPNNESKTIIKSPKLKVFIETKNKSVQHHEFNKKKEDILITKKKSIVSAIIVSLLFEDKFSPSGVWGSLKIKFNQQIIIC